MSMQRIMISGQPGSGKSTLAQLLGQRTGLPVHHMDRIHWTPNWVERDKAAKMEMVKQIYAQPRWIFEGGHSSSLPQRLARADTMIWLDVPVALRLWRVLRRLVVHYGRTRPDMAEGCRETVGAHTVEFLVYIWRTRHSARTRLQAIHDAPPSGLRVVRLTNLRQVRAFLDSLPTAPQAAPEATGT